MRYNSGLDVLRQTPEFVDDVRRTRLDGEFGAAYRYLESLFNGRNPYMDAIQRNLDYLERSAAHRALADAPARSAVLHLGAQPGAEHPLARHRAPEAGVEEQLIIRLGAALAVGLLIGIERERSKGQGPRRAAAGVRTFTLIALAGAISLELGGLPAFLVVAAVIGAFAALSYLRSFRHDPGLTTEVAMVVTLLLGGLALREPQVAGSARGHRDHHPRVAHARFTTGSRTCSPTRKCATA